MGEYLPYLCLQLCPCFDLNVAFDVSGQISVDPPTNHALCQQLNICEVATNKAISNTLLRSAQAVLHINPAAHCMSCHTNHPNPYLCLTCVKSQVKSRQLWGDMKYTSDSDIVAVLMHLGYYAHFLIQAPSLVQEFRVVLKLLPPQERYNSKSRFVRSRAWASGNTCSYQVRNMLLPQTVLFALSMLVHPVLRLNYCGLAFSLHIESQSLHCFNAANWRGLHRLHCGT